MRPSPDLAQVINEKKSLYCRALDTQKWNLLDQCMLPDVKWRMSSSADGSPDKEGMEQSFSSRDAFVVHFKDIFTGMQSIHVPGPAQMEQVSPDEIKSSFPAQWSTGPKGEGNPHPCMSGGGYYHEVWKRVGDDWLMADCVFELTYLAVRPK